MTTILFQAGATSGHLERLNEAQRTAVLHGDGTVAPPLLVIAGAGTGKTNTLAHRIAHLVVAGVDPRRILVMTFSRRAAEEMKRRIAHIAGEVLGDKAAILTAGLTWVGTFHAVAVRILREHAPAIGLDPGFTVHDRGDSADLMNLVRQRLGLSGTRSRFPDKGTCLSIYSRAVNACEPLKTVLESGFPAHLGWAAELKRLFAGYVEAKQASQVIQDGQFMVGLDIVGDKILEVNVFTPGGLYSICELQRTNFAEKIIVALEKKLEIRAVFGNAISNRALATL